MNNDENDLLNPNDDQQQQNNGSVNNNNEQNLNANNNDLLFDNEQANTQKINNNDEANKLNSKDSKKQLNEQPVEDELEKKKKKEQVGIIAESNFNLLNYDDEKEKEVNNDNVIDQKLSSVSKSSGLNLKAYFIEENGKELDEIKKGSLGYTNFTFNGNMKEFYSKVYKHILDSNLIARQLASDEERKNLPTFQELSQQFEEFMKDIGDELVKRGHLEKYEPFGGLSAAEIRKIENGCLLNRPKNEKEAIERNVSNIDGKNFDEVVEKGYMKAADTISNFYGKDYKKGDPNKDEQFLKASADLIKGMSSLRDKEKIWNTYIPNLSAPNWNKPFYKHPISNAFKAIRKGISLSFDAVVKFPVINALRAVRYPLEKTANLISTSYNQRKLEKLVYEKGFSKDDLASYMNRQESNLLNVEDDVKAVEANYKNNQKTIEDYKNKEKQQNNPVKEGNDSVVKEEVKELANDKIMKIEVPEAADIVNKDDIVPEIKDNSKVKSVDKEIKNV